MDPATLALINAGSQVLGRALAPAPKSDQASSSNSGYATFDNSGFNVAFGGDASSVGRVLSPWLIAGALLGATVAGVLWIKKHA